MRQDNLFLVELLKKANHRVTKNKLAILNVLVDKNGPITAKELNKEVVLLGITCNRSTIYRELIALAASGIISQFVLDSRETAYEFKDNNKEHHHHAICLKCKKIVDVKAEKEHCQKDQELINDNFQEIYHTVNIYGYCKKCQK